jgi:hypothetical protein
MTAPGFKDTLKPAGVRLLKKAGIFSEGFLKYPYGIVGEA